MKKNTFVIARIIVSFVLLIISIILFDNVINNLVLKGIVFAAIYLLIGYDILLRAIKNILHGRIFDENFLMTLATLGAFIISDYAEAVAVMLFYQIGEYFQDYAVNKSRKSIKELMDIRPDKAVKIDGDKENVLSPEDIKAGDLIVVKPGERIPLDGIILKGSANLDTSALTGESVLRYCEAGEEVLSGSINTDGVLYITVMKEFYDSTVSKILDMVENVSEKKAKAENFITRFAKYYTPIVVIGAILLAVIPSLFDSMWIMWTQRALNFLVVSCPCALVISVPLGFFGGIGCASKEGILFKGSSYLEMIDKADIFVFDKTGTITKGKFEVQKVFPAEKKEYILHLAAIAEKGSLHPIAKSIVEAAGETDINDYEIEEIAGKGIIASNKSNRIVVGNEKLMEKEGISIDICRDIGTVIYVAKNNVQEGYIVVADSLKENSAKVIKALNDKGIKTVMLTGDNADYAKDIADKAGISEYKANLLPVDKVIELEKIMAHKEKQQVVAFVGDGINDAPVLMRADVGISMGKIGSDSAIEASDIVLMKDDLSGILTAKTIASKTQKIVRENIVFALAIKVIILILSAFGFANMWWAVFGDVGVAFLAILNSMRTIKFKKKKSISAS